jgi:hypothetical protein
VVGTVGDVTTSYTSVGHTGNNRARAGVPEHYAGQLLYSSRSFKEIWGA